MEWKRGGIRICLVSSARIAAALLSTALFACEPQQEAERDRELDGYAASFVLGSGPFGEAVDEAHKSIRYHRENGNLLAARGVTISHLEWLKEDTKAPESERGEFERILAGLDREIAQIPTGTLHEKIESVYGTKQERIAYFYEISTRARTNGDRGHALADLCQNMVLDLVQSRPVEKGDPRLEKALTYCGEAFDILSASKDPADESRLRRVFSSLGGLWQASGRPALAFPYTEKMLPHLSHREIEQQLETLNYMQAALVLTDRKDSETFEETARVAAQVRFLSAKELGNKKEMGLALRTMGASQERRGDYAEAAKSYNEAKDHLAAVGYLALNVPLTAVLDDYDGKPAEADLRAAVAKADANGDPVSGAKAYEALSRLLTRQERLKEASEAHLSMLEAARQTDDMALIARTLFLSSSQDGGTSAEHVGRLSEAARLYDEIGDAHGLAETLLVLSSKDYANVEAYQTRAFALLDSVDDPRLKAMLHQMQALRDQHVGDLVSMKSNGTYCRDHWASIGAHEQVAHCEIVIAEAETLAGDNQAACRHLGTAEGLFASLGLPGRAAMQTGKAEKLQCSR